MCLNSFVNRCSIPILPLLLPLLVTVAGCGSSDTGVVSSSADSVSGDSGNTPSAIEQALVIQQETPYGNPFDDARLTEISGVQRSLLIEEVYYVHNDSGSEPVIYVSDAAGQILGSVSIAGVEVIDWEGLAGALRDGKPQLVIGDIGDNDRQRNDLQLLVIDEPTLSELAPDFELAITPDRIELSYADGLAYDAEALFIDGDNDTVVVLTKNLQDTSAQSIWKGSLSTGVTDGSLVLQYSGLVVLASAIFANAITDVDIHPNGRELAVLTYGPLLAGRGRIHRWTARDGEGTADALLRTADVVINVPDIGSNEQAEGISYSSDGTRLIVGAEGDALSTLTVLAR